MSTAGSALHIYLKQKEVELLQHTKLVTTFSTAPLSISWYDS